MPDDAGIRIVSLLGSIAVAVAIAFVAMQRGYAYGISRWMQARSDAVAPDPPPPRPPARVDADPGDLLLRAARTRLARTAVVLGVFVAGAIVLAIWFLVAVEPREDGGNALSIGAIALVSLWAVLIPATRVVGTFLVGQASSLGTWLVPAAIVGIPPGAALGISVLLFLDALRGVAQAGDSGLLNCCLGPCLTALSIPMAIVALAVIDGLGRVLRLSAGTTFDVSVWLFSTTLFVLFFALFAQRADPFARPVWLLMAWAVPIVVLVCLWRLRPPEVAPGGATLVFLRAFEPRSDTLLRALARDWLEIGRIDLITGPDVAHRPLSVSHAVAWMTLRLSRVFVTGLGDLASSRHRVRPRSLDGRYDVREIACTDGAWRSVVASLCGDAHVVLVDLRGFGPKRRGTADELGMLVGRVDASRVVLIVGAQTDAAYLDGLLASKAAHPGAKPGWDSVARVTVSRDAEAPRAALTAALAAATSRASELSRAACS